MKFKRMSVVYNNIIVSVSYLLGLCQLECEAQPQHALLGYPFRNTAAHMETLPTSEGI